MRRAALERERTLREWHKHHRLHILQMVEYCAINGDWEPGVRPEDLVSCPCDNQPGRFRKGQRWLSKGKQWVSPRDYGDRTRQEAQSDANFREQLRELAFGLEPCDIL